MLTDVVIGSWTSAWLLDVGGGRRAEASADRLVAVGVASALPTVASGLSDFADLAGRERRVGVVHAAGNAAALALHVASLRARRRGSRARGVALSTLGCTAAAASGWLGAKLAFSDGIGVSRAAFDSLPARWAPVPGATPAEGEMRRTEIDGVPVLVAMHEGTPVALSDTCSHLGCSLSSGTLAEGRITCPCHGSTFALDGSVLHGPAVSPQPALEARLVDGSLQVRRP
jgi:nitrite reductase/ring-hydroxylating ferredoxin subunit